MPKDNITDELRKAWMDVLTVQHPRIKFEIKSLDEFVSLTP